MIKHTESYNLLSPQIRDILGRTACPFIHTKTITHFIQTGHLRHEHLSYRAILRVLNRMVTDGVLFSQNVRGGTFWMLTARDLRVSAPNRAVELLDSDIPF